MGRNFYGCHLGGGIGVYRLTFIGGNIWPAAAFIRPILPRTKLFNATKSCCSRLQFICREILCAKEVLKTVCCFVAAAAQLSSGQLCDVDLCPTIRPFGLLWIFAEFSQKWQLKYVLVTGLSPRAAYFDPLSCPQIQI